jgi:hypothetical protein
MQWKQDFRDAWKIGLVLKHILMMTAAAKRSRIAQENEFVNSYATATYMLIRFWINI